MVPFDFAQGRLAHHEQIFPFPFTLSLPKGALLLPRDLDGTVVQSVASSPYH